MTESLTLRIPTFSPSDLTKIGIKIFKNETSGKKEKLIFWNVKEPKFLSIGIGHFLWLSPGYSVSYLRDNFSDFLEFCEEKGVELPEWLQKHPKCPWKDRDEYLKSETFEKEALQKVRDFLNEKKAIQVEFIQIHFIKSLPKVTDSLGEKSVEYCNLLMSSQRGLFALIDYNHFKGQGLDSVAEYNNQAWGLKQVLERALKKDWRENPLEVFIDSARETLKNRVKNAPLEKQAAENGFLEGWFNRLNRYRDEE